MWDFLSIGWMTRNGSAWNFWICWRRIGTGCHDRRRRALKMQLRFVWFNFSNVFRPFFRFSVFFRPIFGFARKKFELIWKFLAKIVRPFRRKSASASNCAYTVSDESTTVAFCLFNAVTPAFISIISSNFDGSKCGLRPADAFCGSRTKISRFGRN